MGPSCHRPNGLWWVGRRALVVVTGAPDWANQSAASVEAIGTAAGAHDAGQGKRRRGGTGAGGRRRWPRWPAGSSRAVSSRDSERGDGGCVGGSRGCGGAGRRGPAGEQGSERRVMRARAVNGAGDTDRGGERPRATPALKRSGAARLGGDPWGGDEEATARSTRHRAAAVGQRHRGGDEEATAEMGGDDVGGARGATQIRSRRWRR